LKHVTTLSALQTVRSASQLGNKRVAFVPTMGALHDGHRALFEAARSVADQVFASVFVNPLQFGPGEDFEAYPRDLPGDLQRLEDWGVEVAFTPSPEVMYPSGHRTYVEVSGITEDLCGASRPGHFRGVATVVLKLLNAVRPSLALFGEKDFQQLVVIRSLVRDLSLPVEIVGVETVREPDGLARSSRNVRLSAEDRLRATGLYRALQAGKACLEGGAEKPLEVMQAVSNALSGDGIEPEYVALRRFLDLGRVRDLKTPFLVLVAAKFGSTRLIDNLILRRP
jgi:pantoate--beta-alanine ligase